MKNRVVIATILLLIVLAVSTMTISNLHEELSRLNTELDRLQDTILSPIELQEFLQDKGYYKGKIDGKVGSQTQSAWFSYAQDKRMEKYCNGN